MFLPVCLFLLMQPDICGAQEVAYEEAGYKSGNKLANELYNDGMKEYRKGNTNVSIKKLVEAVKLDDGFSHAHYMISRILSEKEDTEAVDLAERAIKKAITLTPDEELYTIQYEKVLQKMRLHGDKKEDLSGPLIGVSDGGPTHNILFHRQVLC